MTLPLRATLTPDQFARLDAVSKIELGFPHDFLTKARTYAFGGMFDDIDRHAELGIGTAHGTPRPLALAAE